jgi:hypothetical protein
MGEGRDYVERPEAIAMEASVVPGAYPIALVVMFRIE